VSRRSLVTPIIVAVLATVATGVTFSTAGSSPGPLASTARTATDLPVTGVIVGRGLSDHAAADLSEAFPQWTVDVAQQGGSTPVVVVALRPDSRRWRSYVLRHAADALPARATVIVQSLGGDRTAGPRRARHTAALLSGGASRR
jgi:hypothetical protein